MTPEQKRQWYLNAMGIDQWEPRRETSESGESLERSMPLETSNQSERIAGIANMDWETLEATVKNCTFCPLHQSRTHAVFGVGSKNAELLIIGEAPGMNEDKQGEPFVGRAGQLLNNMLKSIGLDREKVYIANILKSRPPKNRDPSTQEIAACTPYLLRQITLLRPKMLLALGKIAAQYLLTTTLPMSRLRGQILEYGPLKTPIFITYHPAYLLRAPREKRKAWEDMLQLQRLLSDTASKPV